jgi:hypothetical protein
VRFFATLRMTVSRRHRERTRTINSCAGVRFFAALRMTGMRTDIVSERERSTPAPE